VQIHNSHLLTAFLHQLPMPAPKSVLKEPTSVTSIETNPFLSPTPLSPNYDTLSVNIDPFLSQTCDLLLDSIEIHHTESNNFSYYSRALAREQAKISQWQAKRKAENALRTSTKQPLLPEDEWQRLFKLPTEPNRLESMLNSRQVEQYSRQVDGFVAGTTGKMFAVRGNLLPGEGVAAD
jgi:translation initiation factor 3 subunit H